MLDNHVMKHNRARKGADQMAPGANSKFEVKLCYGLEVNRAQSETL